MNPVVSIIIPLYNVEKYVERCVESVLQQTHEDLEVILVNDGSTDNTPDIIKKYAADDRIIMINQENQGQAKARNIGIERASGEYICFLDGDDSLRKDAVERLVNNIRATGSDISCCGYYYTGENQNAGNGTDRITELTGEAILHESIIGRYIKPVVWGKIYKAKLIKDNGLRFNDIKIHEDVIFTVEVALFAKKITLIPEELYIINKRINSLSRSCTPEQLSIVSTAFANIDNLLMSSANYHVTKPLIDSAYLKNQLYLLVQCALSISDFKDYRKLISSSLPQQFYSRDLKFLPSYFPRYLEILRKLSKHDRVFHGMMKLAKVFSSYIPAFPRGLRL